ARHAGARRRNRRIPERDHTTRARDPSARAAAVACALRPGALCLLGAQRGEVLGPGHPARIVGATRLGNPDRARWPCLRAAPASPGCPLRRSRTTTRAAGAIVVPIEVTDEMRPGVVSLPHGWGHGREGIRLGIAQEHPGASANDVTSELLVDTLSGNAAFNGLPVTLHRADRATPER